jgi:hypothetical protein
LSNIFRGKTRKCGKSSDPKHEKTGEYFEGLFDGLEAYEGHFNVTEVFPV